MFIKKCRECTVVNTDVTLTTPRSGKFLSCSIHYFTFSFSYLIFLLFTYKYFHNITPYHVSSHNHFFRCNQNDSVKIPCFKPETETNKAFRIRFTASELLKGQGLLAAFSSSSNSTFQYSQRAVRTNRWQ